ncbi:MAG: outer membrane beta-barrel protein [Proteobacteria bacterium]|nr:outer membrane beta-barrel protein [Pseudomonadota bacterium]
MKKILIAAALIGAVSASSAFAKTEGNYVGIDLLRSSAQVKSNSDASADGSASLSRFYSHNKKDTSYGFGVNYKHAFNFDGFFVAPGFSYNFVNNETKAGFSTSNSDLYSQSVKIKDQISFQTNFGYDVNDKFAVYVPVGVSSFGYEIKTLDFDGSTSVATKKTGRESSVFYGLGLSYQPVKNWLVSLEYNRFQDLKLRSAGGATLNKGAIKANAEIEMIKLGVAYKF